MNTVGEFKLAISKLGTQTLKEYLNILTEEIFSRVPHVDNYVPSVPVSPLVDNPEETEPPPHTEDTVSVELEKEIVSLAGIKVWVLPSIVDRYIPKKCNLEELIPQIELILEWIDREKRSIEPYRMLCRLLRVNTWYLEENARFRETLARQLVYFETDPRQGKDLAQEYTWLTEYNPCAYCGKRGFWDTFGDDYFCSDNCVDLFATNGDCKHKPNITTKELDMELDKYVEMREWLLENVGEDDNALDMAAKYGRLDIIQWLHESSNEECTTFTMNLAAEFGNLEVVKFLHKNYTVGCTVAAMDLAASNGKYDVVKWLHFNRIEGCTTYAMNAAAGHGHLKIVKFLHKHRTEGCDPRAMDWASTNGHLDVVKWLHENRTEGCTNLAMDTAAANGHLHVMKWLYKNRKEKPSPLAKKLAVKKGHQQVIDWLNENV